MCDSQKIQLFPKGKNVMKVMEAHTVGSCQRPSVERNASFGLPWNLINIPKQLRTSPKRTNSHKATYRESFSVPNIQLQSLCSKLNEFSSVVCVPLMQRSEEEPVQEPWWRPSAVVLHHWPVCSVGVLQHWALWKQTQQTGDISDFTTRASDSTTPASYQTVCSCSSCDRPVQSYRKRFILLL